jgi:hypothetical protein
VSNHSEAFVGIDTSKLRNAIAIAEGGRGGEVRFVGEIDSADAATRKLVAKLAAKYRSLTFCYEAGPTGYGLYRLIRSLGHECVVAAPSLIPKKPGVRVKTNRRDAVQLAKLSRAGELTAVWVPDERHEAMRDLSRARGGAEAPHQQASADFVVDASARASLSGQEDLGASPHEVADAAEARASRAADCVRRAR